MDGVVDEGTVDDVTCTEILCTQAGGIDVRGWWVGFFPTQGLGEVALPLFQLEIEFSSDCEGAGGVESCFVLEIVRVASWEIGEGRLASFVERRVGSVK